MPYFTTPYGYSYFPASHCGRVAGQTGNMTLYDILDYGYDLGLTDYPIWDETKRKWLNDMIIDHFMFREIGCETPTQFIFYLNRTMREKMPPINLVFDMLEDVDVDRLQRSNKYHATSEGDSKNDATTDTQSESHSYSSTNPRQTMVGKDPTAYYDAGTFSDTTSTAKSNSDTNSTGLNDGSSWAGYPTDVTNRWVHGVNNALELVFDSLETCFSHIWTNHFNSF
jgi:hypothetical protein